jgi:hypothetical protein
MFCARGKFGFREAFYTDHAIHISERFRVSVGDGDE